MGTYLVMVNNFRRSLDHKLLFILTLFLPVLLCLAIGLIRFDKSTLRIGLLMPNSEAMNSAEKEKLYHLLDSSEGVKYKEAAGDTLNTELITGKFQAVLDYRESPAIDQFEIISYQKEEKTALLQNLIRSALSERKPVSLNGLKKEGLSVTERSMAILLTLFMVLSSVHASSIIRDRQEGMVNRYQYACKSSKGYILGYVFYSLVITYIQISLSMLVLMLIQKDFSLSLAEGLILSIILSVCSVTFSMLICLCSRSEVQANITSSALAAVMSILGGAFVAIDAMPALLRILSMANPMRWVVELIRLLP